MPPGDDDETIEDEKAFDALFHTEKTPSGETRDLTAKGHLPQFHYKPMDSSGQQKGWIDREGGAPLPTKSCLPGPFPGSWILADLTERGFSSLVQGWKIHAGCHPEDFDNFFTDIGEEVNRLNVAHKFLSFDHMAYHEVGKHVDYRGGEGKSCVIYPKCPKTLVTIVNALDTVLQRGNAAYFRNETNTPRYRPYPGGVRADIPVGRTGFLGVRYGVFKAGFVNFINPTGNKLYDPTKKRNADPFKQMIEDPRLIKPHPDFFTTLPSEILAIKAY